MLSLGAGARAGVAGGCAASVRLAGFLVAGLAVWLSVAPRPAYAVQTNTFSITPTGERTSIVMTAGRAVRTDHFVLRDLRSHPITIALAVFSLRHTSTGFARTAPSGFGEGVQLPASRVRLAGGQTKVLAVRVDTRYRLPNEQFAVIDAHTVPAPSPGGATHLQLVVELKPAVLPGIQPAASTADDVSTGVAAGLILVGLIAQLTAWLRRRRTAVG